MFWLYGSYSSPTHTQAHTHANMHTHTCTHTISFPSFLSLFHLLFLLFVLPFHLSLYVSIFLVSVFQYCVLSFFSFHLLFPCSFPFFFFSHVLRDSTPRFVGPSVHPSVRPSVHPSVSLSHFIFWGFLWFSAVLLLPKWSGDLNYGPCSPARNWGSRVSGLVFSIQDPALLIHGETRQSGKSFWSHSFKVFTNKWKPTLIVWKNIWDNLNLCPQKQQTTSNQKTTQRLGK